MAPDDLTDAGSAWEDLGGLYNVTGSILTVRLSDLANGYVIADAIRIERLGDLPTGPAIVSNDPASPSSLGAQWSGGSNLQAQQWAYSQSLNHGGGSRLSGQSVGSRAALSLSLDDADEELIVTNEDDTTVDSLFAADAILPELLLAGL